VAVQDQALSTEDFKEKENSIRRNWNELWNV